MSDIVERLRHVAWLAEEGSEVVDLATTAADEIVRLRTTGDALAEVERLRAEVSMLRAAMAALDAFHRPIYDDDIDSLTSGDRFCAADDEAWPCSTHRLLHPAEASRDEGIKQDCVKDRSRLCVSWQTCGMSEECYYDYQVRVANRSGQPSKQEE